MTAIPDAVIVIAVLLMIVGRIIAKPQRQGNGRLEKWPWEI